VTTATLTGTAAERIVAGQVSTEGEIIDKGVESHRERDLDAPAEAQKITRLDMPAFAIEPRLRWKRNGTTYAWVLVVPATYLGAMATMDDSSGIEVYWDDEKLGDAVSFVAGGWTKDADGNKVTRVTAQFSASEYTRPVVKRLCDAVADPRRLAPPAGTLSLRPMQQSMDLTKRADEPDDDDPDDEEPD
jgi:hypothetical protein